MTMEEYLRALRKELNDFSPEDQEALIAEVSTHIEDAEADPRMGKDLEQRRKKLMNELGSAKNMSRGFKDTYRPDRFIDYLLIVIPYLFYPYLNSLYLSLMTRYSWADVRLDILIHLPLIAVGLWRRSGPVTLFWISILVSQLSYITTQLYWYYGIQTIFWALLLLGLLLLAGYLVRKNRNDLLTVVFGFLPLSMCIIATVLALVQPTGSIAYGFLDRSLLVSYLFIENAGLYLSLAILALFFLSTNREFRWLALALSGLMIGLGRDYLIEFQTRDTMMPIASWVYYLWIALPLLIVFLGWWLERSKRQQLKLATA
ncbi:MAG TPA: hypothetical protein VK249_25180 [Anaerolineales bacterium]|nr:hypothetical protein [Anaerolineales bacterium]